MSPYARAKDDDRDRAGWTDPQPKQATTTTATLDFAGGPWAGVGCPIWVRGVGGWV
jgi:hypothetical protein